MRQLALQFEDVVDRFIPRLRQFNENETETRAGGGTGWSRRDELGHLIDSATNNRVRFLFAALNGEYRGATYDGDAWVRLGGYAGMEWEGLVDAWQHANRLLIVAVGNITDDKARVVCTIGDNAPVTLQLLIEDYIHHMQQHLDHICGPSSSSA